MRGWALRLAILSLSLATGPLAQAQSYTIVDLGTLGGSSSIAWGINSQGQVVGYSYLTGGAASHAFLYANGMMTDLGTLGGTDSVAYGIDADGRAVGNSNTTGNASVHAFVYANGVMTDLGTLGGTFSSANGGSPNGQIVGDSTVEGDAADHAFLYANGVMTDLGTLGGTNSVAFGVNDAGQVVGESDITGNGAFHAFLYANGVMTDLGTLGGTYSYGYGVNGSGQVVGRSNITGNTAEHAFLYTNGVMTDLGTLGGSNSSAQGINDQGLIVGNAQNAEATQHAFLYSNGAMNDLNDLLPENSGWVLTSANAINNNGQIVGSGVINGETHAFLMSPAAQGDEWLFDWPERRSPWIRSENQFLELEKNLTWQLTSHMFGPCELINGPIDGPDDVRRWAAALVKNDTLHGIVLQAQFPPVVQLRGRKVDAPAPLSALTTAAPSTPAASAVSRPRQTSRR